MGRNVRSFSRREKVYKVQPTVLVVCEDTKSAKIYFEEGAKHLRAHAKVEFAHVGRTDPRGVVEGAVLRKQKFDSVYCVIDRDSHDERNFVDACRLADENGIKLIISYPCFEFWLILHFGYTRAGFKQAGAQSAADQVLQTLRNFPQMKDYEKGTVKNLFNSLSDRLDDAIINSKRAIADAEAVDEWNPSTRIHELVEDLRQLGVVVKVRD